MRKFRANDGGGYKTVCYDLSCGDYVTADDKVELPTYLVNIPSQNDVIIDIGV